MRNGKLIAEDDPLTLMRTHGATKMEQVVFKISQMDEFHQNTRFQFTSSVICESENINVTRKKWNDEKLGIDKKITTLAESLQRSWAYSQVVWINFIRHPMYVI